MLSEELPKAVVQLYSQSCTDFPLLLCLLATYFWNVKFFWNTHTWQTQLSQLETLGWTACCSSIIIQALIASIILDEMQTKWETDST